MTTYTIEGRDRYTNERRSASIVASCEDAARQAAASEGVEVESITPAGLKAARPASSRPTQHGALDAVGSGISLLGLIVSSLGLLTFVAGLVMANAMGILAGVYAVCSGLVLWIIGAVLSRIDRR